MSSLHYTVYLECLDLGCFWGDSRLFLSNVLWFNSHNDTCSIAVNDNSICTGADRDTIGTNFDGCKLDHWSLLFKTSHGQL